MRTAEIKKFLRNSLGVKTTRLIARLKHLLFVKKVSREELAYIEQVMPYVSYNQLVLDIGANEGLWTHALAENVGPKGQVVAFEPVKDTYRVLTKSTKTCNNIILYNLGLSEQIGTARILRDPVSDAPPAAAITKTAKHLNNKDHLIQETIEISTLDEVFKNNNQNISFIKIDVEGHEEMVLRGGLNLIKKCKPVIFMEILHEYWNPGSIGLSKSAKILLDLGYEIHQIKPKGIVRRIEDFQPDYENFLFIPI